MNKSKIIGFAVLIAAIGAGFFFLSGQNNGDPSIMPPPPGNEIKLDPKNAAYEIEGDAVTLVNGSAETKAVPGSASVIATEYFGNEAKGDFNGDKAEDIAFLLTQDSGGSGVFFYVAVLLGSNSTAQGTNAIFLGDRIAPQTTEFRNGEIIVNFADRKPDEPMSADPSVGVSKYFKISGNKLIEIEK